MTPKPKRRLGVEYALAAVIALFCAGVAAAQQAKPPIRTLRFEPATLGYADEDEVTPGCVGILVLDDRFYFEDSKNCWSGPNIDGALADLQFVRYEIWEGGTVLTFRLRGVKRPFLLGLREIPALKTYRHIATYSPATLQSCTLGSLDNNMQTKLTPIPCAKWASQ